eukprot:CAMPEP_0178995520 /NCGR_PEP_ID=MMETSP0795-20121207/7869_1 /TAXON_ID=88552 /ORGANISM="Amoebophrya sp., Strain Ameob2" /LENGTH=695 /DNA_ID=CAMNT_0020687829 /DNA_START=210 /DNA_END=2297 /DNA_ORIENTATION=+
MGIGPSSSPSSSAGGRRRSSFIGEGAPPDDLENILNVCCSATGIIRQQPEELLPSHFSSAMDEYVDTDFLETHFPSRNSRSSTVLVPIKSRDGSREGRLSGGRGAAAGGSGTDTTADPGTDGEGRQSQKLAGSDPPAGAAESKNKVKPEGEDRGVLTDEGEEDAAEERQQIVPSTSAAALLALIKAQVQVDDSTSSTGPATVEDEDKFYDPSFANATYNEQEYPSSGGYYRGQMLKVERSKLGKKNVGATTSTTFLASTATATANDGSAGGAAVAARTGKSPSAASTSRATIAQAPRLPAVAITNDKEDKELQTGAFVLVRCGEGTCHYRHPETGLSSFYTGQWLDDLCHGKGTYSDAESRYVGCWQRGEKHGFGEETWKEDGTKYHGMHCEGVKEGKGRYVWADGSVYEGDFEDDAMTGYGVLRDVESGSIYAGQFEDSVEHGNGRLVTKLLVYEGQWADGLRHGVGEEVDFANNYRYVGHFFEGVKHGIGREWDLAAEAEKTKGGRGKSESLAGITNKNPGELAMKLIAENPEDFPGTATLYRNGEKEEQNDKDLAVLEKCKPTCPNCGHTFALMSEQSSSTEKFLEELEGLFAKAEQQSGQLSKAAKASAAMDVRINHAASRFNTAHALRGRRRATSGEDAPSGDEDDAKANSDEARRRRRRRMQRQKKAKEKKQREAAKKKIKAKKKAGFG